MEVAAVLAAVAGLLVVLGLVSGVVSRSPLTLPMLAVAAGVLLGPGLGVLPTTVDSGGVLLLAEVALAVLLFVDASRVDTALLFVERGVPARMLAVALPATIALGTLAGATVLGLSVGAAFLLACLLAPTDAALGESFVEDERAPAGLRQSLLVESGLNDGLVVPFLVVAFVVVGARDPMSVADVLARVVTLVGGAGAVGVAVGGGLGWSVRRVGWRSLEPRAREVATAAVGLLAWSGAEAFGGSGFVAAFVAGLAFGAVVPDVDELVGFAEDGGDLLALLTFVAFGAVFVAPALDALEPAVVAYVLLSLTVVRMLPVVLSLLGRQLDWVQLLALGWFGPRGLATVVFGLTAVELADAGRLDGGDRLFGVAALVVLASVVAHGMSAGLLVRAVEGHPLPEEPGRSAAGGS